MYFVFSIFSVAFAALAAGFWAWSSLVNLPVIGSAYGTIANLEPFYAAMKKVGRPSWFPIFYYEKMKKTYYPSNLG
jgi:hypothetical protein